ncbi:MAG: helix-turn-helix transcriptional regulator [Bdellovibrionaceae bacterium]|nr:helix-turn-helix transcriptional regulator [Pseudobdellovibrionaceae bacterium]
MKKSNVKKSFGDNVRKRRQQLGITQEELADRAELHRTYVCDVERGARNVSLENIDKIASALEFGVAELFPHPEYGLGEGREPRKKNGGRDK